MEQGLGLWRRIVRVERRKRQWERLKCLRDCVETGWRWRAKTGLTTCCRGIFGAAVLKSGGAWRGKRQNGRVELFGALESWLLQRRIRIGKGTNE